MNTLDYILIFVLLIGTVQGFRKGFINQLGGLVAVILALLVAFKFSSVTENFLEAKEWISQSFIGLISIALTFALVYYGVNLISKFIHKIISTIGLGIFNRIAGGVLGFAIHAFVLGAVLYFLYPFMHQIKPELLNESQYGQLAYTYTREVKAMIFD